MIISDLPVAEAQNYYSSSAGRPVDVLYLEHWFTNQTNLDQPITYNIEKRSEHAMSRGV